MKGEGKSAGAAKAIQPGLFDAPFENLPLRDAIDFYHHERGWANRLVAGDSLLVMNSLIHKESMAGKVQMFYFDPPYGIKYGSNFQPFVGKRDVKDRNDADLTQEPEMIKAFRDTWELGIHSYLTYLRDRLLLARELLNETGSVFVQIGSENVDLVRGVMDEIFGRENLVNVICFQKTSSSTADYLGQVVDYLVWYGNPQPECGRLLSPAEMVAFLLACMTDEDNAAGQLLACVLLSGIPPLELQGAEWDLYEGAAGQIELTCQEEDVYKTYTLSRPAMDLLHKLRGDFPFYNYVFHHNGEIVFLDEMIDAFERIAARAEMPLLTVDDLLLSYQYIAFAGALFDAERCGTA